MEIVNMIRGSSVCLKNRAYLFKDRLMYAAPKCVYRECYLALRGLSLV